MARLMIEPGSATVEVGFGQQRTPAYSLPTYCKTVEHGAITDFVRFGKQISSIFDLVGAPPIELLLIEPGFYSPDCKNRLMRLLLEKLRVPRVLILSRPAIAATAYRTNNAVVVDLGAETTSVTLLIEGSIPPAGFSFFPVTGKKITEAWKRRLIERGYLLIRDFPLSTVDRLKIDHGYVAKNFTKEKKTPPESVEIRLPDSSLIELGDERFTIPEAYFDPLILDLDHPPLDQTIHALIETAPIDYRKRLSEQIIVTGGGGDLRGFRNRLSRRLKKLRPSKVVVRREYRPSTTTSVGARTIFADQTTDLWFSRRELEAVDGKLFK